MPIYDFKCDNCGAVITQWFSNWRAATAATQREQQCECGGRLVKQISAPNFQVNGFNAKNGYSGER